MTEPPAEDGTPARSLTFITRVRLKNYKSIAWCNVRLGPLTVLVGPNGSGKSNFLDALAFLTRALATTPADSWAGAVAGMGVPPRRLLGVRWERSRT
jgi:hypothetical protein